MIMPSLPMNSCVEKYKTKQDITYLQCNTLFYYLWMFIPKYLFRGSRFSLSI